LCAERGSYKDICGCTHCYQGLGEGCNDYLKCNPVQSSCRGEQKGAPRTSLFGGKCNGKLAS